jgi:orotate phosphoribosyltransferase
MTTVVNRLIDRQTVTAHLRSYSVKVAQPGHEFDLASGGKSRLYIDAKRTYLHRSMHRPLAALLRGEVEKFGHADAVAGVALGGCHLASIVAAHDGGGNYNVAFVRKAAKDHGTKSLVEHSWGRFGEWVVLLEDVVSTGQSSALAVQALRADGFDVRGVVTMVDRRPPDSRVGSVDGVELRHLFGLEDLEIEPDVAAILPPSKL